MENEVKSCTWQHYLQGLAQDALFDDLQLALASCFKDG